jgi:hypothetical protein
MLSVRAMSDSGRGGTWLARVFWILAGGEVVLAVSGIWANSAISTGLAASDHDLLLDYALPMVIVLLAELMWVVFLMRKNKVAPAIGLALLLVPLLLYGSQTQTVLTAFVVTPSPELVRSGHGFSRRADRALADAIVARDAAKVAALAPAAKLKEPNWNRETFMHLALEEGGADYGVVAALLSAGGDPDGEAFDFATDHKDMRLLRMTIDAGIDLNIRGKWSPRFFSAFDWLEGLSLALEHGANPDAEDYGGESAMTLAVSYGNWPLVDILLAHGARIDDAAHQRSVRAAVLAKTKEIHERGGQLPPQLAALSARVDQ